MKAYLNWSGGKDAALALYHAQKKGWDVPVLFTSMNAVHNRITMHGVRRELLQVQAAMLGLPLHTAELPEEPGMTEYEQAIDKQVRLFKSDGFTHSIYGDIFLEDLRQYREQQAAKNGMQCLFPLWKRDTGVLMREFIALGFRAIVVCVNGLYLDPKFCGRIIDETFVQDLPEGVDVCGERGEYHSFVFAGPLFPQPLPFIKGETIYRAYRSPGAAQGVKETDTAARTGFYFCDLLPAPHMAING